MAVGLAPPLAVLLETGFQVRPQLSQGLLVAGLLGEGVVEGRQFAGFEVFEADLKTGFAAGGVLLGVALGELAIDGFALPHGHADHPFHKAGDHATFLQLHFHGVAAATGDGLFGIGKNPAKAEHGHIGGLGGPAFHGHQGCQLLAGLLDQFIDPGGVIADAFGFGLKAFGGLEFGGGLDIELEGDGEVAAGIKALQHHLEAFAQLGAADGGHLLHFDGIAEGRIHQVLQGGGADPQGPDLLEQHWPGNLALAEPGQFDAAAQLLNGCVVAGLAARAGDGDLQGNAAAGAGAGGHLEG